MSIRTVVSALFIALLLAGCSSPSLSIQISSDRKSFSWKLDGQEVDPVKQGVNWRMNYTQWDESGQPIRGQGKATVKDPKNTYDALAEFEFDETGYKRIKLTVSGGTLSKEMTAEANRP